MQERRETKAAESIILITKFRKKYKKMALLIEVCTRWCIINERKIKFWKKYKKMALLIKVCMRVCMNVAWDGRGMRVLYL